MPVKPIPEGFHTVTPYVFAKGAPQLMAFISAAFNGEVTSSQERPDGSIMHAEMHIGDSIVLMAEATEEFPAMPASFYLYVIDCDGVFDKALAAGGISIFPLMNLPSGERYGGVKDPCGNIWWIATHVEDVSLEEQARRWKEFRR